MSKLDVTTMGYGALISLGLWGFLMAEAFALHHMIH